MPCPEWSIILSANFLISIIFLTVDFRTLYVVHYIMLVRFVCVLMFNLSHSLFVDNVNLVTVFPAKLIVKLLSNDVISL